MPIKAVRSQIAIGREPDRAGQRACRTARAAWSRSPRSPGWKATSSRCRKSSATSASAWHPNGKIIGRFTATGVRSHFSDRFKQWGYDLPAADLRTPRCRVHAMISAQPIIYVVIFVAVLAAGEGIYLVVFGKSITPEQQGQPPAGAAGKGRQPRTGAGTTPQGDDPAHESQRHPALFDPRRQGAEGQHRLLPPQLLIGHGGASASSPSSA